MRDRVYVVPFENVTIGTAVADIFSLLAGSAAFIEVHHIHLEANVSAQAALRMRLKRGTATVAQGSGGTAPTPAPVDDSDAAASGVTVHLDDTTQATTSGAFTTLAGFYWDVSLPFDHLPAPEDREKCKGGEVLVLDLPATIVSTVISGYVKFALA